MALLAVGLGGALGASARYGFNRILASWAATFPFATLASNVVAALFIGLIVGLEQQRGALNPNLRLFIVTGALGGLSTFSTFSLETVVLARNNQLVLAIGNIGLNLALSLVGVVGGVLLARSICR